jgi:hypothetical protein
MSPTFHRSPLSSQPHQRPRPAGRRVLHVAAFLLLVLLPWQGSVPGAASAERASSDASSRAASKTPRVFVALKKNKVTTQQRAHVKVVVSAQAGRRMLFGKVKVEVKGGGKNRKVLAAMADHRTVVALPKLPRGFYKVRATFLGNGSLSQASSKFKKLTVVKAGGGDSGPSGWPNASNTGVPAGVSLKPYTGSCSITSKVTIDSKTVNCPGGVAIRAAGVVISNSMVNGTIEIDTDENRSWSLTLTDSEVNADGKGGVSAIGNGNVTIVRANIHGGHNGLQCEEHSDHCSLEDSWIHDQYIAPGSADHLGGMADFGHVVACTGPSAGGVPACVNLVHNTIVCDAAPTSNDGGCTGDINMLTQLGPLHGAIVKDNFLGANTGAAYCTYGGYNSGQASDHIIYTGNTFERGTNHKCAQYGPVTSFDSGGTGNVWTNNNWDDGTAVKPAR